MRRRCTSKAQKYICSEIRNLRMEGFASEKTFYGVRSYGICQAGTTRMLMSTARGECVSKPTEMKSTPVSA
jgi:hypothetical protein